MYFEIYPYKDPAILPKTRICWGGLGHGRTHTAHPSVRDAPGSWEHGRDPKSFPVAFGKLPPEGSRDAFIHLLTAKLTVSHFGSHFLGNRRAE